MKTTMMKKIAACLLALLMVVQIMPVFAEAGVFTSNEVETSAALREKLEVVNPNSLLLVGQTVQLSVPAGYDSPKWTSSDESIATISEEGVVTAVSAGTATITVSADSQTAKDTITVINPTERYTISYEVTYPGDATIQLYPDVAPSRPQNRKFEVETDPLAGNSSVFVTADSGEYDTDNYVMTGWKADDGKVYAKGDSIKVSGNMKLKAVFESTYDGSAKKGKARFLGTDHGIEYFKKANTATDNNAPEEYKNERWKFLSVYCYPSVAEDGTPVYTFRLPEATRDIKTEGEGYNLNMDNGAATKTFVGYRLLKILGVDDISAYTDKVYGIGEQVTLPRASKIEGYFFAPVFVEGQTGEAQVKINYNGKITYIAQGALSQDGMDALAGVEWTGSSWNNKEASIGGDTNTAIDSAYLDNEKMPGKKAILRAYGMSAEDPADWELTWYKIARTYSGYYVVGNLTKKETKPAANETMVIIINGQKGKLVYNGEEQSFGEYTATSNDPRFDPEKVKVVREGGIAVSRKDCGIVTMNLSPSDFAYDDPDVNATFIVSNGWLKITPAVVTVRIGNLEKQWGEEDPDFEDQLIIEGLFGNDTIDFHVEREAGENADFYKVTVFGDQGENSNYKVQFVNGILNIVMPPVTIKSSLEGVSEAPAGTVVTLTAQMDGLDTERYHIQWQMADTQDVDQMVDIQGANDITYSYVLDKDTAGKFFRVVVTLK